MALQNIGASNSDDAFYRYKMPKMITKIEGRGNGIKTNVVNMVEIAKALARPASYTTKYFGNELGAQSKFDEKTGTSLVNGAHDTAKLAGLLENFIKKDKLTTFILKSPPEPKKGSKDKKAMRRAEKERLKEGFAKEVSKKKNYLAAVTQEEGSQMLLLNAIESFCGEARPEVVKEVPLAVKVLYDNDVLEEEFILEWYRKGLGGGNKSSPVWKNVKPFVEWLQNAESESEEE
ncbi:hypothetical protein GH714_001909 [Hevea brasiliensis]|uniref:W2 domain-containing protein n=1 Tax=Hevea brasiliensis TaxID=3981 RepID=A0A6A6L923_HEVBR|nr:hypothetical protein GH714_001909 [Hevea brasiliensis]